MIVVAKKYICVATVHHEDALNVCNSTVGFGSIKFRLPFH